MDRLISVDSKEDIFEQYRNTPVSLLLEYHNLGREFDDFASAQMLVGMCMDNRKYLHIPDNFAYIIRTGGGNLRYSEFKISYAIAIGGVKAVALIAHNHCGMVSLMAKREQFINGLVETAGWDRMDAEQHFMNFAPVFEIGNEIDFVLAEVTRFRKRYPNVTFAPIYYNVDDNKLYQIIEDYA